MPAFFLIFIYLLIDFVFLRQGVTIQFRLTLNSQTLRDLPALASHVLGLQACTTVPAHSCQFYLHQNKIL